VITGEYYAVALDTGGIPQQSLNDQHARLSAIKAKIEANDRSGISKDDLFGDMLYSVILTYFYEVDALDALTAQTMNIRHMRLPSEGIFSLNLKVNYLFGVPKSVQPDGMAMDVDRIFYAVAARNGDPSMIWKFGLASGPLTSALEHSVPEQLLTKADPLVEGVSAVKALSLANGQGIPIYTITSANAATILPQLQIDSGVRSDVNNAINAGKIVVVSKTSVTFKGRSVIGYVILDPATGTGAYMISGSSGAEVEVLSNVILGLLWGIHYFLAFSISLLGAPFFVPVLISILTTALIAAAKFGATGDSSFNPGATLIGLIVGASRGAIIFDLIGITGPGGLFLPVSASGFLLVFAIAAMIMLAITIDYISTFVMEFRNRRRKVYA
jgi:hypothetical protein